MGIFDRMKEQEPAPEDLPAPAAERKPFGPGAVEIAKLISSGDEAVMADITACTGDPAAWFQTHEDRYMERGVTSADELEDFSYFVQNLHGFQALGLKLDPDWLDEDGDISEWCGVLTEQWSAQGVRMAAIDIDSDSYVLFPASAGQLAALQTLAEEIGQDIQDVTEE